jgi:hypothetical protein
LSCRASAKSLEACFPCVYGGKIRSQTDCREATNGLWSCSVARPPGACEERHKHLRYLSSGFGEHAQLSSLQHILRGAWSNQGEPPWNRGSAPGSLAGSCVEAKTWAGPPEATVLIAGILAATKTWRRRSFAVAQGARDVRKRDVPDHELVVVLTWEIRELWAQFLQSLVRQHDSPSFQARFLRRLQSPHPHGRDRIMFTLRLSGPVQYNSLRDSLSPSDCTNRGSAFVCAALYVPL